MCITQRKHINILLPKSAYWSGQKWRLPPKQRSNLTTPGMLLPSVNVWKIKRILHMLSVLMHMMHRRFFFLLINNCSNSSITEVFYILRWRKLIFATDKFFSHIICIMKKLIWNISITDMLILYLMPFKTLWPDFLSC